MRALFSRPSRFTLYLFSAFLLSACVHYSGVDRAGGSVDIDSLRLIGQQILGDSLMYRGTRVGGLSGIDYAPNGTWYIISDDRSAINPARFYTARLEFDEGGFHAVTFTGATLLLRRDGTAFPNSTSESRDIIDPEAIRFAPGSRTLFWSSEGDGEKMIDPLIVEMNRDGSYLREIPLPEIFRMSAEEKGPRNNGVFEGLALSLDERELIVSLEDPLRQDGPAASPSMEAPVRVTRIDQSTGGVTAQYAYMLDRITLEPPSGEVQGNNGLVEILPLDTGRLLFLERSFVVGAGNSIRLYEGRITYATDISSFPSLLGVSYTPIEKRLLLDFATLGLPRIDNIEGMSWGPVLKNGHRTLAFVSDNNFSSRQITQIILLEVLP